MAVGQDTKLAAQEIRWEEPNRGQTKALHISSRGQRFSTVTGVAWLDEFRFVANHQNGMRVALFDRRYGDAPLAVADLPCLTDDVAVKRLTEDTFELALSGCFDCALLIMQLSLEATPSFRLVSSKRYSEKTFAHGVAFDHDGQLWLACSTGANMGVQRGAQFWRLPTPWGPRNICFHADSHQAFMVAVSNTPKLAAYEPPDVSVWRLEPNTDAWHMVWQMPKMHSDSCQIYGDTFWLTDQMNDRVLGIDLAGKQPIKALSSPLLDFPHGLSISDQGMLAVTNYGGSSIALFDIRNV